MTGVQTCALPICLVVDWKSFKTILDELGNYALAGFLTGIVTFTLGALIVTLHNDWSNVLSSMVTLIGWGALIEGLLLLAFRRRFVSLFSGFPINAKPMIPYGGFAVLLGLFLIYGAIG